MKTKKIRTLLPLLLLILTPFLMADMGPKPSASFEITYQADPPPLLTGYALFMCGTADCHDPHMLEEAGPQRFECTQDSCYSMAYGYDEFMYITMDFANGSSFTSNIFSKDHFDAEYEILVGAHSLEITETGGSNVNSIGPMGAAVLLFGGITICGGALVLALIILAIVLIVRNQRKKKATAE